MDYLAKKAAELAISLKKLPPDTCGDDPRLAVLQQLALQIAHEIYALRVGRPVGESRGKWLAAQSLPRR